MFGNNRTLTLNTVYKILLKAPMNDHTLRILAGQLGLKTKNGKNVLILAFQALQKFYPQWEYPYILLDSHQQTGFEWMRIRSRIFPDNELNGQIVPMCFIPS